MKVVLRVLPIDEQIMIAKHKAAAHIEELEQQYKKLKSFVSRMKLKGVSGD